MTFSGGILQGGILSKLVYKVRVVCLAFSLLIPLYMWRLVEGIIRGKFSAELEFSGESLRRDFPREKFSIGELSPRESFYGKFFAGETFQWGIFSTQGYSSMNLKRIRN